MAVNGRGSSAPSAAVRVTTKAALYKFDVQLAGGPLMPGYTELSQNSRYTPEIGWGWLDPTGLGGRDRGVNFTPPPNDLQRDFLLPGTQHVFAVDVPDGSYAVKTYNGDWIGTSRSNVPARGQGLRRLQRGRGVGLGEGQPAGARHRRAAEPRDDRRLVAAERHRDHAAAARAVGSRRSTT